MRRPTRPSSLSDLVGLLVAAGAVVVAGLVVFAAIQVGRTVLTISSDPLRDTGVRLPQQTPSTGLAGMFARGDRVNVLLLGYGGAGHDGAYLTDTLMVASIDSKTNDVTLISIPRDMWVTFPKDQYATAYSAKINSGFAIPAAAGDRDEGMRVADATVESILGVHIDRTVAIDFRAFRTVVDAIGGIDVTVDRSFTALYPRNDDPNVDPSWIEISFRAGAQHMDGETALRFARARYSDSAEGNDFARAARQQKVILAAKDGIVASDAFTKLFGLMDALRDNVRTDLSIADMQALASFARAYDDAKTTRAALTPENVLQSGYSEATGYALWPKVVGWSEVHAYVRRILDYPKSFLDGQPVVVQVSLREALAGRSAVERLSDLGFDARLELVTGDDPARTIVGSGYLAQASAAFLASYFGDAAAADPKYASDPLFVRLGTDWVPPVDFDAPLETPSPEPSTTPEPTPSASSTMPGATPTAPPAGLTPTVPPTRTPRPSVTPRPPKL